MIILGCLYSAPPSRRLRGVICREIEKRLAGRAETGAWFTHTVKSHRQQAAAAAHQPASDTDLSPCRSCSAFWTWWQLYHTSQCRAPHSSGLLLTTVDAVQKLPINDFHSGTASRGSESEGESATERRERFRRSGWSGGHCLWWINLHDWKHKERLQSCLPEEYGCFSSRCRKNNQSICLNAPVLCLYIGFESETQPGPCRKTSKPKSFS